MLSIARNIVCQRLLFSTSRLSVGPLTLFSRETSSEETHDDFKTISKPEAAVGDVYDTIREDITQNRIFIYMKGHPQAPKCGFSMTACQILDHYESQYKSRDVLEDPALREAIKKFSNWPTIPQVFVNGEFIGGCDILVQMHQNEELNQVLKT